jgi:uncharacterized protein (DUF2236 family)
MSDRRHREPIDAPISQLRLAVLRMVGGAFGSLPLDLSEFAEPAGDPGLFGPGSMPWRVHADLPSMLIGGLSALMLQSLHPLAMAGVEQHSNMHEDYRGRLYRTGRFVGGTVFGAMPFVEQLISQVRGIHDHVHGVAPDGRPYSANDPQLLTFVHTAEVWSFLRGYQRHSLRPLLAAERDEYLDQMAEVAIRLGATQVPRSAAEVRRYFQLVRPELAATPGSLGAVAFLRRPPELESVAGLAVQRVVFEASVELLPGWSRRMLGLTRRPPASSLSAPIAASGLGAVLRWATGESPIARVSQQRVAEGRLAEAS